MKESDLYLPVKGLLESQGYEVKGEVHDCDVVALRGDEAPVVVELKLNLNLDVLLQAVARLTLTPKVYIGVPEQTKVLKRKRRQVHKLLRMLSLGLIVVDPGREHFNVQLVLDPGEYKPRKSAFRQERLLGEFMKRVGDPNVGGADRRRGLMTVYRQRVLGIARYLEQHGPTKASDVAHALGEPKARQMMYQDHYGWFDRKSKGIYALSPRGRNEIESWSEQ